jgi:hypothetical protein
VPLSLSGVVTSYTPATTQEPGALRVGGLPLLLAPGTTLAGISLEPGLRINLDARLDPTGRIAQGTARSQALEEERLSWIHFSLQLIYLIVLIGGAVLYHARGHVAPVKPLHAFLVDLLPATIGPVPIAIPWFATLGAVARGLTISYGELDHNQGALYRPRQHTTLAWYIARPFIGAAFGVFVFTFFLTILDPTGKTITGNEYGVDILAFIIGYADGTFAALVQRATHVLLGPGDANSGGAAADQTVTQLQYSPTHGGGAGQRASSGQTGGNNAVPPTNPILPP